ncbi:hypothetical protein GOODEAATRI_010786 [Goodea atripinnis]|uniref:Uncharacterized protein n=1 Tax=Goodea atripinnis TaxID=208336 RepID=A0ABV0N2H1_9TELE
MQKILKDQEEFEKEHQFMQEEQIEPAPGGNSTLQSESSWKIPPSSHVLMRASQVSSEIREGDESYLRLSLGQFFGQRSEALGCLGSQELQDRSRDSPEKNVPGNITATLLPQSSEKQAEIFGLNAQPSRDPLSGLDDVKPCHSKSLDPLPAPQCKSPEVPYSGPALSCTRSQSECNYPGPGDILPGFTGHKNLSESDTRKLAKVDSGYSSNLNIQQTISSAAPPGSQQWGAVPSMSSSLYAGGLGLPPPYSAEGLHYVQIPGLKPQCPGMVDLPHKGDIQSLLTRRTLVSSQLPLQYLGPEAPLHSGAFHLGPSGNRLYSVSSAGMSVFLCIPNT